MATGLSRFETVEPLENAIQVLLKTASGPAPTDPFYKAQWEMASAHATLIRGLLSTYKV